MHARVHGHTVCPTLLLLQITNMVIEKVRCAMEMVPFPSYTERNATAVHVHVPTSPVHVHAHMPSIPSRACSSEGTCLATSNDHQPGHNCAVGPRHTLLLLLFLLFHPPRTPSAPAAAALWLRCWHGPGLWELSTPAYKNAQSMVGGDSQRGEGVLSGGL